MSILDSNARWADEDKAMGEYLAKLNGPNPEGTLCSHGCGRPAPTGGIGAYCDACFDDSCLVPGPEGDGVCGLATRGCDVFGHDWYEDTLTVVELTFYVEYQKGEMGGDPRETLLEILAFQNDRDLSECITVREERECADCGEREEVR